MSASACSRPPDPGGGASPVLSSGEVGVALGSLPVALGVPAGPAPLEGQLLSPSNSVVPTPAPPQGSPGNCGTIDENDDHNRCDTQMANSGDKQQSTAPDSLSPRATASSAGTPTPVDDTVASPSGAATTSAADEAPSTSVGSRRGKPSPADAMRAISAAAAGRGPKRTGISNRSTRQVPAPTKRSSSNGPAPTPRHSSNGTRGHGEPNTPARPPTQPTDQTSAWARPLQETMAEEAEARHANMLTKRDLVRDAIQTHKQKYAVHYDCAQKPANVVLGEYQRDMTPVELKTLELYQNRKIHLDDVPSFVNETMTPAEVNKLRDFHEANIGFYVYGPIPPGLAISNGNAARKQLYMLLYRAATTDAEKLLLDMFLADCVYWECSRRTRMLKARFKWPYVRDLWDACVFRITKGNRLITLRATDSLTTATAQIGLDKPALGLCYAIELLCDSKLSHEVAAATAKELAQVEPAAVYFKRPAPTRFDPARWCAVYPQEECPAPLEFVRSLVVTDGDKTYKMYIRHVKLTDRYFPCDKCLCVYHATEGCPTKPVPAAEGLKRHSKEISLPARSSTAAITATKSTTEFKKKFTANRLAMAPGLHARLASEADESKRQQARAIADQAAAEARKVARSAQIAREVEIREQRQRDRKIAEAIERRRREQLTRERESLETQVRSACAPAAPHTGPPQTAQTAPAAPVAAPPSAPVAAPARPEMGANATPPPTVSSFPAEPSTTETPGTSGLVAPPEVPSTTAQQRFMQWFHHSAESFAVGRSEHSRRGRSRDGSRPGRSVSYSPRRRVMDQHNGADTMSSSPPEVVGGTLEGSGADGEDEEMLVQSDTVEVPVESSSTEVSTRRADSQATEDVVMDNLNQGNHDAVIDLVQSQSDVSVASVAAPHSQDQSGRLSPSKRPLMTLLEFPQVAESLYVQEGSTTLRRLVPVAPASPKRHCSSTTPECKQEGDLDAQDSAASDGDSDRGEGTWPVSDSIPSQAFSVSEIWGSATPSSEIELSRPSAGTAGPPAPRQAALTDIYARQAGPAPPPAPKPIDVKRWLSEFPCPAYDAWIVQPRRVASVEDWKTALKGRVITVPGGGRSLWYCLYAARTRALTGTNVAVKKGNTKEAKFYCVEGLSHLDRVMEPLIRSESVDPTDWYLRCFRRDPPEDLSEVISDIRAFLLTTRGMAFGDELSDERWPGHEELSAIAWYFREPIFVILATGELLMFHLEKWEGATTRVNERVEIRRFEGGEAQRVMTELMRHRFLPTILVADGDTNPGHFSSLRLPEWMYVEWSKADEQGVSTKQRLQLALGSLGLYVPPERQSYQLAKATVIPKRAAQADSDFDASGISQASAFSISSDLGDYELSDEDRSMLRQDLNPHGRLRCDARYLWRHAEIGNVLTLDRTSKLPWNITTQTPSEVVQMALEQAASVEDAIDLLNSLPVPEVAIATSSIRTTRVLGRELLALGRPEALRKWADARVYATDTDAVTRWVDSEAGPGGVAQRWKTLKETLDVETSHHAPPASAHRKAPLSAEDAWNRAVLVIIALDAAVGALELKSYQAQELLIQNPQKARDFVTQLRHHVWSSAAEFALLGSDYLATALLSATGGEERR